MIAGGVRKPLLSIEELTETPLDINKDVLKTNAYQNIPLNFGDAYRLGVYAVAPYRKELHSIFDEDPNFLKQQATSAMCALHNQATYTHELAAEQIAGISAAIFDYDIGLSDAGFLNPDLNYVIDNCGMGGDLLRTPNVSTAAAIVAAREGINMLKHGSPGNTDSTGSSDFLEYLGVDLFADKQEVEAGVEASNFGYTEALDTKYKTIHKLTHEDFKIAHMNDIIGPITNPVNPTLMTHRIIGINHLLHPEKVAEAYNILNEKSITNVLRGYFVRGFADKGHNRGMDEVSTLAGGTIVAELNEGQIETYILEADDFGLSIAAYDNIKPVGKKDEFSKQILENKLNSDVTNLISANAALILKLINDTPLEEGTEIARNSIAEKNPLNVIETYNSVCGRGEK